MPCGSLFYGKSRCSGLSVEMQGGSRKLLELELLAEYTSQFVLPVFFWETALEFVSEPLWLTLSPREISQRFGEIKIQHVSALHYALYLELSVVDAVSFLYEYVEGIAYRCEVLAYGLGI